MKAKGIAEDDATASDADEYFYEEFMNNWVPGARIGDVMSEMLHSPSCTDFIKAVEKMMMNDLNLDWYYLDPYPRNTPAYRCTSVLLHIPYDHWTKLYMSTEFIHLLWAYGYAIHKRETDLPNNEIELIFEQTKQEACRNAYDMYHGVFYHVTRDPDRCVELGLRPKNSKHRDMPTRVYMFGVPDGKSVADYARKTVESIDPNERNWKDYSVIRIDLNKLKESHIDLYRDGIVSYDWMFYAYSYIPQKCIEKLDLKLF